MKPQIFLNWGRKDQRVNSQSKKDYFPSEFNNSHREQYENTGGKIYILFSHERNSLSNNKVFTIETVMQLRELFNS